MRLATQNEKALIQKGIELDQIKMEFTKQSEAFHFLYVWLIYILVVSQEF